MPELKVGDPVQLTTRHGDTVVQRTALVFGVYHSPGLTGPEGEPFIDTISPNLKKMALAGRSDWIEAVERHVGVLHSSHEAVTSGRHGTYYDHFDEPFTVSLAKPTDEPEDEEEEEEEEEDSALKASRAKAKAK